MVPPLRGFFFGKNAGDTLVRIQCRIRVQVPADQRQVADRGGHQDVGLAAARDEIARDVLMVTDQVLCGCRLVIDVARIDIGAAVEEQLRDGDG